MPTLSPLIELQIREFEPVTEVTFEQGLVTVTLEEDKSDTIDAIRALLRDESLPVRFKFGAKNKDPLIAATKQTAELSSVQTTSDIPVAPQADPYASTVIFTPSDRPAA